MHLAQLNIAKPKYSMDSTEIADFVNNLEPINAIAESSSGFIWRLKDKSGDATNIRVINDPEKIVNMSVWEDIDSLKNFMFKTHHLEFMKRKKEWFHTLSMNTTVLWWIPAGHTPTLDEAIERLAHLQKKGESPKAFNLRRSFNSESIEETT